MARRLSAFAFALALMSAAGPAAAQSVAFDLGLVRPGMPLAELRQAAWPSGARLLCSGDPDLPPKVDTPPRDGIALPPRLAGRGLVACGVFDPDAHCTWKPRAVEFAGAPAKLWVLAIVQPGEAGPRVVQAKLWQENQAFASTIAFITGRLGPAEATTSEGARWSNDANEVIVGHASSEGILTIATDKALEGQVRERLQKISPKANP